MLITLLLTLGYRIFSAAHPAALALVFFSLRLPPATRCSGWWRWFYVRHLHRLPHLQIQQVRKQLAGARGTVSPDHGKRRRHDRGGGSERGAPVQQSLLRENSGLQLPGAEGDDIGGTNPPDDREKDNKGSAGGERTGVGQSMEYRMRHKNGSWRTLESRASTIRNDQGTVERLVIVNRDVTERKQLEEQFRQHRKMEAVGRLQAGWRTTSTICWE